MIKKTYRWKEVTSDGLLKEPKEFGPYYSTECLNGWGGHESEEYAKDKLEHIYKAYPHDVPTNLILIAEYQIIDNETDS